MNFKGSVIEVTFFEPKEVRQLQLEEEIDKRAYEHKRQRDQLSTQTSNMQDMMGPLNFLMSMMSLQSQQQQPQPYGNNRPYSSGPRMNYGG